jgi:hypothetical protein
VTRPESAVSLSSEHSSQPRQQLKPQRVAQLVALPCSGPYQNRCSGHQSAQVRRPFLLGRKWPASHVFDKCSGVGGGFGAEQAPHCAHSGMVHRIDHAPISSSDMPGKAEQLNWYVSHQSAHALCTLCTLCALCALPSTVLPCTTAFTRGAATAASACGSGANTECQLRLSRAAASAPPEALHIGGSSRDRKKTKSDPSLAQPAAQPMDGTTRTLPWLCTRSVTIRLAWCGEGASGNRSSPG